MSDCGCDFSRIDALRRAQNEALDRLRAGCAERSIEDTFRSVLVRSRAECDALIIHHARWCPLLNPAPVGCAHPELLAWRGIDHDDACPRCRGGGRIPYGSTATWSGRTGMDAMTDDVCDLCWGSGAKSRPGLNLRLLMSILTDDQAKRLRLLVDQAQAAESEGGR